ncbi:hypothetical protein CR205_07250 [Alteribacter lacisalsi]|uniref:YpoC-like domain-containing protein n=1 Tax=Alteribacter lacisalsi TaxID=2045244 RepID=A0A2W0HMS7_9BACI|nr:hypothetical protein [Alteribacter lacisalsi]PYZ98382.1 hypothetical protein CR205_07250 [Alteribacter lacisalsi]
MENNKARPGAFQRRPFTGYDDQTLFEEDIAFVEGTYMCNHPWKTPKSYVMEIERQWREEGSEKIASAFRGRNKQEAEKLMIYYASRYIQAMSWAEGKPVTSLENIAGVLSESVCAPVNLQERLSYVLASPSHHQSFTVLDQLFAESRKKWAVYFMKMQ